MFEIGHHPFRCLDQALHEGGRLVQQRLFAGGTVRGTQFGLEVPVQVFVRIDFGRVRREIEDFDLVLALGQPSGHELGMMHFQVVENQEVFLTGYDSHIMF